MLLDRKCNTMVKAIKQVHAIHHLDMMTSDGTADIEIQTTHDE
jgi:hypothetical protein